MNKSHITDEQVRAAREQIGRVSGSFLSNAQIRDVLEDAFPEQQPAAFGPLIVTEDDAEEINYAKDIREALQSFVNRHAIKPIAFSDKTPEEGQEILYWSKCLKCWSGAWKFEGSLKDIEDTYWLPASALPIPEVVAVDPMDEAWKAYENSPVQGYRENFIAGYEAGQANNCPKE